MSAADEIDQLPQGRPTRYRLMYDHAKRLEAMIARLTSGAPANPVDINQDTGHAPPALPTNAAKPGGN